MSNQRSKRDSMSLEETTVSTMWEIAAATTCCHDFYTIPFSFFALNGHFVRVFFDELKLVARGSFSFSTAPWFSIEGYGHESSPLRCGSP
jgi:hypothetical protein